VGGITSRSTPTGKLRLTRRAWLLLWMAAVGIAVADARLLVGSSITVTVQGRSVPVATGQTVDQAPGRLGMQPAAGDLLAVDHSVLHKAR
jgi:hypothetical protein